MDKTPIKIRGKRASTRPVRSTDPKGKRPLSPTSRTSSPTAKLPRENPTTLQQTAFTRPLSYLELLPVELLEVIFYYCLNPSLPQASIAIGQKLNSTRIKSQLVLRTLSTPNSFEYPCRVSDVFPTLQEQAKAQSAILRLRWMTLPFFRQLIPDYIVHTVIRELGVRRIRWMEDGSLVTKESEPVIRRYLEDNAARIDCAGRSQMGLPAHCKTKSYWEIKWIDEPENREVLLGVGLQDGLVTLREREMSNFDDPHKAPQFSKWRICGGVEGCQVPEKLLHGPWTDEKCEFLEVLIRGNAEVDRVNSTSGEVAEQGLWEAIEEQNARAVRALVARVAPYHFPWDIASAPYGVDSSYREDPICKGVGIVPRQEHLRRTLEDGGTEGVLRALLGAAKVDFDITTPDIQLWVRENTHDMRAIIIHEDQQELTWHKRSAGFSGD